MSWVFVNQEFYKRQEAVIGVGDLVVQRGYGAFDYFRTSRNRPLFLEAYLDRFFNSAAAMYLQMPVSKEQLRSVIEQLMAKNQIPDSGIRMVLTGGYAPDSYTPVAGNLIIDQTPLQMPDSDKFDRGVKIMTHAYVRDLPTVKSVNYLMGIWLQHRLAQQGLDDVLYYDAQSVTEFPRANLFMINKAGELLTPKENVLAGITRMKLLELASRHMPVRETAINRESLFEAAELFMTSTTKRILPVVEIDGFRIGAGRAGELTRTLQEAFIRMEEQEIAVSSAL